MGFLLLQVLVGLQQFLEVQPAVAQEPVLPLLAHDDQAVARHPEAQLADLEAEQAHRVELPADDHPLRADADQEAALGHVQGGRVGDLGWEKLGLPADLVAELPEDLLVKQADLGVVLNLLVGGFPDLGDELLGDSAPLGLGQHGVELLLGDGDLVEAGELAELLGGVEEAAVEPELLVVKQHDLGLHSPEQLPQ